MDFLKGALKTVKEFSEVVDALQQNKTPCSVCSLSRVHKANVIDTLPECFSERALVVVSDEGEAQKVYEDLTTLGANAKIFPARDLSFRKVDGVSREAEQERIGVLCSILNKDFDVIIAPIEAIMTRTVPSDTLKSLVTTLKTSMTIELKELVSLLVFSGYNRVEIIESAGQFSVRGGIVDVFVPGQENPYRIEFWGDEIDTICTFDTSTQRRADSLDEIEISPAREILYKSTDLLVQKLKNLADGLKSTLAQQKEYIYSDIQTLESGLTLANIDKYMNLCFEDTQTLLDYMQKEIVFVYDPSAVAERIRTFSTVASQEITELLEEGVLCKQLGEFYLQSAKAFELINRAKTVLLETFSVTKTEFSVKKIINFSLQTLPVWNTLVSDLYEDVKDKVDRNYSVFILAGSFRAASTLCTELREKGLNAVATENPKAVFDKKSVVITCGNLVSGIDYTDSKIAVFTQGKTAAKSNKRKKFYTNQGTSIGSLEELKVGEPVVHSIYGIGLFQGIKKVEMQGIIKDYITIKFQKSDTLYVPVTQLDLVCRYIGSDSAKITLSKLGGEQWIRTKQRVKSAAKDMAKELIALYSKRLNEKGFAFSPDNDLQQEFEYYFPYEETFDQLRCIEEIKKDMESSSPMERLLCGDVGFGKTEVALRAAFKAVLDGKQVAFLVPTTILAWQHYNTILKRMESQAVNVEMLSRFRTPKQTANIKKRLKNGEIDILVGTHRLISESTQFFDLGLLIIDEEQRFGVAQKEKLKQKFPSVDVLTLSATPIPRTLNMALTGIRDMSIIEEAPSDRRPVQTFVLEYDKGVVLDAIRKELARGGQVYYIYNRVETITQVAARLARELPDARVEIAHGQMSEAELSERWQGLVDNTIDVLVCTTIIETGVDVPNVNTLIIENADCFGLSQLHQLRGRVGRSARRAYAYFTYHRGKVLREDATKRLEAIREYTEFGSGFKIAMCDLEIRGAGNVIGAKQHGHMDSVGYDMYVKLLQEAISEEKGEKATSTDQECLIDLPIAAHIPEDYISSLSARLQIYRRIALVKTKEDSADVIDELIDRFGEPPKQVLGLIDIALLRASAILAGVSEVTERNGNVLVYFKEFNIEKLKPLFQKEYKQKLLISAGARPYLTVRIKKGEEKLELLNQIFSALCDQK